ncbi:unnamed protein product [marine sediment metagenome]|uniref:Phage ABA sandwich domain-containing protein n=1 Tax=marine sediment metagenome TaxID=412755 RepID=X1I3N2_9ZZZZ
MTKEEILAMGAGVEMDTAVHQEVMCRKEPSLIHPLPEYSEDISATWQILKRLREEYWCIEVRIADGCWVIMELLRTPPIKVEVNAGTPFEKLPEAICKAALLAKLEAGNG